MVFMNVVLCGGVMQGLFYDMLEANPVIAAVKDMEGLGQCCQTEEIRVVFILFGDLCSIGAIVEQVKAADKVAMVHMDLVQGLSSKEIAVDFIKQYTKADGIISTKPMMIKRAKELELYTVMRFFLLDSMALENLERQLGVLRPDVIEILPGVMPKIIRKICGLVKVPVITDESKRIFTKALHSVCPENSIITSAEAFT
jgi:glycerol uptake operon antiterminator